MQNGRGDYSLINDLADSAYRKSLSKREEFVAGGKHNLISKSEI
jgi:hypothetical protein